MNNPYEFINVDMKSLNENDYDSLVIKARAQNKGVFRYNLHKDYNDALQEMVICFVGHVSECVHRHEKKDEIISIIKGELEITFYDDVGNIINQIILSKKSGAFSTRIPKSCWHGVVPRSDIVIFHEISTGPFDPSDMIRRECNE